jgi:hypothetical protein
MEGIRQRQGGRVSELSMPCVEEHAAAPGSSPDDSPRVVRMRRVSQVGAYERAGGGGRRPNFAQPELEAEALLRDRFLHHLTTMVKLSNLVCGPGGPCITRVKPPVRFALGAGTH